MPQPQSAARLIDVATSERISDRRGAHRVLTILRIAKLVTADGEELCMIRNIAAGGAKLRVYSPREVGERIALELRSGECATGVVRWVRDESVGVAFDRVIDADAVIACQPVIDRQQTRAPRLSTRASGRLTVGAMMLPVTIADLSQGGVKILTDIPLPAGAEAQLEIAGLAVKRVLVRWQRMGAAGLAFTCPLSLAELAQWTNAQRVRPATVAFD